MNLDGWPLTPSTSYEKKKCQKNDEKTSQRANSWAQCDLKRRTKFTVGGDRINYPGEVATPTAKMLVAKTLFNSVISTRGAKFMTMDMSNFYLMTPLKRPEYTRVKLADIPQ